MKRTPPISVRNRRTYQKPKLKKIGTLASLTLAAGTGSILDTAHQGKTGGFG